MLGELSGSMAHELNQPLTAISNNASAARRFIERGNTDPALMQQLLQDMINDSQRAGEVIRGIRSLVSKDKGVATEFRRAYIGFDGTMPSGLGGRRCPNGKRKRLKEIVNRSRASIGHCHASFHRRFCLGHSAAPSCRRRRGSR